MTSFIENIADLSPAEFLKWVLEQYFDDKELPCFEECIAECYKSRGAEKADVSDVACQYDGYIHLVAGVQSIGLKPPEWMRVAIDSIGYSVEAMNSKLAVCNGLIEESIFENRYRRKKDD